MYRKIMGFLEAWKDSEHRKPLILQGARQVGKTYSILEFGRTHYENVAYFNFETNPKLNMQLLLLHLQRLETRFLFIFTQLSTAKPIDSSFLNL